MKTIKFLAVITIAFLSFTSCSDEEEICTTIFYADVDGDGYGDANNPITACQQPDNYVDNADDNDDGQALTSVISATVSNLAAVQTADYSTTPPTITGDYVRFSFETGAAVTDDNWDIAFRGSTIIVNGGSAISSDEPERTGEAGVYLATGTLADIAEVDTTLFAQDDAANGYAIATGSGNGWYNYDFTTHLISPIAGTIIIVKTINGTYAKLEILSYYLDADTTSSSQHYTFNYVYQPNNGLTVF
ncbi:HmuY family protein [uncultured Polaribacter sp.]|uniref:HmuY family protein n=1 Tax=uncultured Polaribacter sp. TaxID=174711 RepID=UPI002638513E|nr:HmuY family protein [uncultured Polaribacter sp.]